MMEIKPIDDNNTDFDKVYQDDVYGYPNCKQHGAMNKVSVFETGGYWRCLQGLCRAGCEQVKKI